jgi:hypothetical protein
LEILHQAGCLDQVLRGSVHVRYGDVPDSEVAPLRRPCWDLVDVVPGLGDPARAGLGQPGGEDRLMPRAVLVRPDGYIGFRAVPAGRAGLRALDAHLDTYLVPAGG